jgi:hypothetical protein
VALPRSIALTAALTAPVAAGPSSTSSSRGASDGEGASGDSFLAWSLGDDREVVTLAQTSYHPLFARPVDWFAATTDRSGQAGSGDSGAATSEAPPEACLSQYPPPGSAGGAPGIAGGNGAATAEAEAAQAGRFARLLNDLQFFEPPRVVAASVLLTEEEDWFGSLSGGQRAKADFVRTVQEHVDNHPRVFLDGTRCYAGKKKKKINSCDKGAC